MNVVLATETGWHKPSGTLSCDVPVSAMARMTVRIPGVLFPWDRKAQENDRLYAQGFHRPSQHGGRRRAWKVSIRSAHYPFHAIGAAVG